MKNKTVKTVLGASILAATLSAQAQSTPKKSSPTIEPKTSQGFEIQIGKIILIKDKTKNLTIKDSSEDLKSMLNGSKTEGSEK